MISIRRGGASRKGFSLIEVMIALAMLTIIISSPIAPRMGFLAITVKMAPATAMAAQTQK